MKPTKVLRTWTLYKMMTTFFSMSLVVGFIASYQKSFGQIYIQDDRFFAIIGTVSSFINGCSRIIWGYGYDRFGFKVVSTLIG